MEGTEGTLKRRGRPIGMTIVCQRIRHHCLAKKFNLVKKDGYDGGFKKRRNNPSAQGGKCRRYPVVSFRRGGPRKLEENVDVLS